MDGVAAAKESIQTVETTTSSRTATMTETYNVGSIHAVPLCVEQPGNQGTIFYKTAIIFKQNPSDQALWNSIARYS